MNSDVSDWFLLSGFFFPYIPVKEAGYKSLSGVTKCQLNGAICAIKIKAHFISLVPSFEEGLQWLSKSPKTAMFRP